MVSDEIHGLIKQVIETSNNLVTTDWLSYCLYKSVDIEVLAERIVEVKKSLKGGLPSVNSLSLMDNDFYNVQDENWKKTYELLCTDKFTICIERIDDIRLIDNENVNVVKKQVFLQFDNPS